MLLGGRRVRRKWRILEATSRRSRLCKLSPPPLPKTSSVVLALPMPPPHQASRDSLEPVCGLWCSRQLGVFKASYFWYEPRAVSLLSCGLLLATRFLIFFVDSPQRRSVLYIKPSNTKDTYFLCPISLCSYVFAPP